MSKNGAKHWVGTINNYVDEDESQFEDTKELATYYVYGKEVGSGGNRHLQCYWCFKRRTVLSKLKQMWPRGHFEVMQSRDPSRAANYCKKGEQSHEEWELLHEKGPNFGKNADFTEFGELPESAATAGGRATAQKWLIAKEEAKKGNLDAIDPCIFITNYKNLKDIKYDHAQKLQDLDKPCGEWIYGPTGVGKSYTARKENPDCYKKPMNKWWNHYEGEDVVLIEDMSPQFGPSMEYFMKIWPDCYVFPAEIKNHVTNIRPKKIVVTSQYHPNQIWTAEALDAIMRRFKLRKIEKLEKWDNSPLVSKKRALVKVPASKLPPLKKPMLNKQLAQAKIVTDEEVRKSPPVIDLTQDSDGIMDILATTATKQKILGIMDCEGCGNEVHECKCIIPENDAQSWDSVSLNSSSEEEDSSESSSSSGCW